MKVSADSGLRNLFFCLSDLVLVFWQIRTLKKSVASVRQDAVLAKSSVWSEETDHTERTCLFTGCDSKFCPLGLLTIPEGEAYWGLMTKTSCSEKANFHSSFHSCHCQSLWLCSRSREHGQNMVPICLKCINLEKRIQVLLIKKTMQQGVNMYEQLIWLKHVRFVAYNFLVCVEKVSQILHHGTSFKKGRKGRRRKRKSTIKIFLCSAVMCCIEQCFMFDTHFNLTPVKW